MEMIICLYKRKYCILRIILENIYDFYNFMYVFWNGFRDDGV